MLRIVHVCGTLFSVLGNVVKQCLSCFIVTEHHVGRTKILPCQEIVKLHSMCRCTRSIFLVFLQQIEHLDNAYLEQKGELAALQERLDDLARAR